MATFQLFKLTKSGTFGKFGHCVQAFKFILKLVILGCFFRTKRFNSTSPKNEVLMHQKLFLKRKMDAIASTSSFLASTKLFVLSQWEAFLSWGLFDKTTLQIVPKNGLLYMQVNYKYFVIFTSWVYSFQQIYKCILRVHMSVLISVLFV